MWQIIIPSLRFGISDTDYHRLIHRLIHEPPIPLTVLTHTNSGFSDPPSDPIVTYMPLKVGVAVAFVTPLLVKHMIPEASGSQLRR
jgi:hypothetical protein